VKNPAAASAVVLVALALAVGGFAWMATGTGAEGNADVLKRTEGEAVGFVALSPREQRKKNNLEQAKRELSRIRQVGEEVSPGIYKIEDETGDATYYRGDLIPGKGRDGEPMYLSVQFKRMPAPPLKERKVAPAKMAPKLDPKRHDGLLKGGVPADGQTKDGKGGASTGSTGGDGSGSGSGAGSGSGTGPGTGPK
jgi:hypothetical protein